MIRRFASCVLVLVLAVAAACGKDAKDSQGGPSQAARDAAIAEPPDRPVATGATPEAAFRNYQVALAGKDLDFLWWFVSSKDKAGSIGRMLEPMTGANVPVARLDELARGFGTTPDGVRAMSKRAFDRHFLYLGMAQTADLVAGQVIESTERKDDDHAVLNLDQPRAQFALVREDGQWRWDMIETSRLNDPE